jgi:hypothetical protein
MGPFKSYYAHKVGHGSGAVLGMLSLSARMYIKAETFEAAANSFCRTDFSFHAVGTFSDFTTLHGCTNQVRRVRDHHTASLNQGDNIIQVL